MLKGLAKILFGKQIRLRRAHADLVARLSLDEAMLAHNEITYGYFSGALPSYLSAGQYQFGSSSRAYELMETATSLYEYIMRLRGTPITLSEKAKYRVGLASTVGKILRDSTADLGDRMDRAAELVRPFELEQTEAEIDDRSNLNQIIFAMNRAAR